MTAEPIAVAATDKFKTDFSKSYPKEKGNSDCGLFPIFCFVLFEMPCCPALQQILDHGFVGTLPTSSGTEFSKAFKYALNCKHALESC